MVSSQCPFCGGVLQPQTDDQGNRVMLCAARSCPSKMEGTQSDVALHVGSEPNPQGGEVPEVERLRQEIARLREELQIMQADNRELRRHLCAPKKGKP